MRTSSSKYKFIRRVKVKKIFSFCASMLALSACNQSEVQASTPTTQKEVLAPLALAPARALTAEEIKAQQAFAFESLKQVATADENMLISPLSLRLALTMAAQGAEGKPKSKCARPCI